MGPTIVVGANIAGVNYKETLRAGLEVDARVAEVIDVGVRPDEDIDYPRVAVEAAWKVATGEADRALLVCGTGMGMAIVANKIPGIRASVAYDSFSMERLVLSNDAQILTLGGRVIGLQLVCWLMREWLGYTFDPESSSGPKAVAIRSYESDPH